MKIRIEEAHYVQKAEGVIGAAVKASYNGKTVEAQADGNGRLDAVANALAKMLNFKFNIDTYTEHALERRSTSEAVSYVGITTDSNDTYWGVGRHSDIIVSSIKALVSAINNALDN